MKNNFVGFRTPGRLLTAAVVFELFFAVALRADPQVDSWLISYSSQYARIYTSDAAEAAGKSVTTWSNGRLAQSLPAYCGAQEILTSSNWVYVFTTGLASYTMGPWYINASRTRPFPNLPVNQKMIFRIPRNPSVPALRTSKRLGEIGMFVDGVRMFDATDAFSYSTANGHDANPMAGIGQGDRIWNRDAWVNERVTFDAGYAHQQNTGRFHYHANPIALRYLLGDHVDYDSATGAYHERADAPTRHSPIIGWMHDGYPLYGPYGYANPTNPADGVRRIISGYGPRDGTRGADNISNSGRVRLPAWSARVLRRSSVTLAQSQIGPAVSGTYPVGHYLEDYAYLGDCGLKQGVDFDLDECNGRWCVTPEFPNGTYAYFSTINTDGSPAYPYNMGRLYHGNPTGGLVTSIPKPVFTNFIGGADAPVNVSQKKSDDVVILTWSAVEGGTYLVESSGDNSTWTTNASGIAAVRNHGHHTLTNQSGDRAFDVKRTSLARYDSVKHAGNGILGIVPASGARGSVVDVTVSLDWTMNPPPPFAPINRVAIGRLTGTENVHVNRTKITSEIVIPVDTAAGKQTVSVVFPGPPDDPSRTVTYTLTNGFTIN